MVNYSDEHEHILVIRNVIAHLFDSSAGSDLVLKGGTALLLYYGLDRFSEDIDLDATKVNIHALLQSFAKKHGYTLRVTKDSPTVKRYMLEYSKDASLKVEVSYRGVINPKEVSTRDGVRVYTLEKLFMTKINAFLSPTRNKIRDLYDIAYLYFKTDVKITDSLQERLYDMFSYDNLENIDYIIENHKDIIIPDKDLEQIRIAMYSIFDELYKPNTESVIKKSSIFDSD